MSTVQVRGPLRTRARGALAAARGELTLPCLLALALTLTFAFCPLTSGYYSQTSWGPLALATVAVLTAALTVLRPQLTRSGRLALVGLLALLALSALSLLWAQSKENAWTDTNRLALYAVVLVFALTLIRTRAAARLVVMVLGFAALVCALVLAFEFVLGTGTGAFLARRLNSPMGYVNGTAGLMAMGLWPWLALASTARRRSVRAGAQAAATAIAATAVLTQSRAVVPALLVAIVLTLIAERDRSRRGALLALMFAGVALALPWVLHVYTEGGFADHDLAPTHSALRGAGAAILISAAVIGALRWGASLAWPRVGASRQALLERWGGRALLGAVTLAVVCGVVLGHSSISRQYHAFVSDKRSSQTSVRFLEASGPRYDLWRVAVREFRSHPIGGVGAGNYDTDYYRLRRTDAYVLNPHSIELQMLAELGIFGLLGLVLFCGAVFWSGLRRRATLAASDPLLKIAALGVFTTWLVETSVDWLYDIPGLTGMAMIAAALLLLPAMPLADGQRSTAEAQQHSDSSPPAATGRDAPAAAPASARAWAKPLLWALPFAALAIIAASIGRQYAADLYGSAGSQKIISAPRQALAELHSSYELNPDNLQTLYWIADSYGELGDYTDERTVLLQAQRREPSNYVPPALLGELAASRDRPEQARSYFRRSLLLNPIDPIIRRQLRSLRPTAGE